MAIPDFTDSQLEEVFLKWDWDRDRKISNKFVRSSKQLLWGGRALLAFCTLVLAAQIAAMVAVFSSPFLVVYFLGFVTLYLFIVMFLFKV